MSKDASQPPVIEYAAPEPWYRQVNVFAFVCSFACVVALGLQLWSYVHPFEITLTRAKQYAIVSEDGMLVLRVRTPLAWPGGVAPGPLSDRWRMDARLIRYPIRRQGRGPQMALRRLVSVPHTVLALAVVAPVVVYRRRRGRSILPDLTAPTARRGIARP